MVRLREVNDFNERFSKLKVELEAQLKKETRLNTLIVENLEKVMLLRMRDLETTIK